MRTLLLVILMMETWLPIYGQNKATEPQAQKQNSKNKPEPREQLRTPVSSGNIVEINQPAAETDKQRKANNSDTYLDALVSPNNLPNVILSVIGIIGVVIAICTLRGVKKQADLMEGQLLQMQSGTRPWLGMQPQIGIQAGPITISDERCVSSVVETHIENFGSNPGLIPSFVFAEIIVGGIASASKAVAERLDACMAQGLPKGRGPQMAIFPQGKKSFFNTTFITKDQIVKDPDSENLTVYLVGVICYSDGIGKNIYHTAFSYVYWSRDSPGLRVFELQPNTALLDGEWREHRMLID